MSFFWACWQLITGWTKQNEQKNEYETVLVCSVGINLKRIEKKVCKKFSGNLMELCLSVNAYGIGCCIILDYL